MNVARDALRCERGTAAVELAFIGMLLILGTVGTIEIGRALFMMNELAHVADRAARIVMLNPDILESDLTTAVNDPEAINDRGMWVGLAAGSVKVAAVSAPTGFRAFTLSYDWTPMVSNLIPICKTDVCTLWAERRIAQ